MKKITHQQWLHLSLSIGFLLFVAMGFLIHDKFMQSLSLFFIWLSIFAGFYNFFTRRGANLNQFRVLPWWVDVTLDVGLASFLLYQGQWLPGCLYALSSLFVAQQIPVQTEVEAKKY